ncbi:Clan SB, family S8, subtilisin-like serine peptidase [Histomonas meleagridis]|uniref:Clan SB, family S8, subtilisin-like serine peptidase n=1 Tax=Histomonas meleagridis TaxID=135588 RepID=UPI00355962F5|nr:Clan SB, family S8, subtilisin-like serine peptidase [Histomonas meleagridis]KAH0805729.1 Clan SB, family S8, subtilisin-like serine peptidase [Histomonas meleagridis]
MGYSSSTLSTRNGVRINAMSTPQNSMKMVFPLGWYYLRLLVALSSTQIRTLKTEYNIELSPKDMIQRGWYKKFFTQKQIDYLVSNPNIFQIFSLKEYYKPDLSQLNGKKLLVHAACEPSAIAKKKNFLSNEYYIVEGGNAEKLFQDPCVADVEMFHEAKPLLV